MSDDEVKLTKSTPYWILLFSFPIWWLLWVIVCYARNYEPFTGAGTAVLVASLWIGAAIIKALKTKRKYWNTGKIVLALVYAAAIIFIIFLAPR